MLVVRRRVILISAVAVFVCVVIAGAWAASWVLGVRVWRDSVSRRIAERVASDDGRPIDLTELADFDWDRVYCFDCYSGQGEIEKRLGFKWPGLGGSEIEMSEGVTLIVFVKDGRVVRSFDQPRNAGDFGGIDNPGGLSRSEARFVVSRKDGHSYLKLVGRTEATRLPG